MSKTVNTEQHDIIYCKLIEISKQLADIEYRLEQMENKIE